MNRRSEKQNGDFLYNKEITWLFGILAASNLRRSTYRYKVPQPQQQVDGFSK